MGAFGGGSFREWMNWKLWNDQLTGDQKTTLDLYLDGAEKENCSDEAQKLLSELENQYNAEYPNQHPGQVPDYNEPTILSAEEFGKLDPNSEEFKTYLKNNNLELPTINTTVGGKDSDVTVSTAALQTFSNNVLKLEALVRSAWNDVNKVNVKPGGFGAAALLSERIQGAQGAAGLRGDTLEFLKAVLNTFYDLRADIVTLKTDYETTEEWNKLDAQGLNNLFSETWANYNQIAATGEASGSNNGNTQGNPSASPSTGPSTSPNP